MGIAAGNVTKTCQKDKNIVAWIVCLEPMIQIVKDSIQQTLNG
jgi:hypothetical protein